MLSCDAVWLLDLCLYSVIYVRKNTCSLLVFVACFFCRRLLEIILNSELLKYLTWGRSGNNWQRWALLSGNGSRVMSVLWMLNAGYAACFLHGVRQRGVTVQGKWLAWSWSASSAVELFWMQAAQFVMKPWPALARIQCFVALSVLLYKNLLFILGFLTAVGCLPRLLFLLKWILCLGREMEGCLD